MKDEKNGSRPFSFFIPYFFLNYYEKISVPSFILHLFGMSRRTTKFSTIMWFWVVRRANQPWV